MILTVTRAHSIRNSLKRSPVDGKNAGVARITAAADALIAYLTCCCLNQEKNPHREMKNRRHLVFGKGVCNVFMVLRLLGTNVDDGLRFTVWLIIATLPSAVV